MIRETNGGLRAGAPGKPAQGLHTDSDLWVHILPLAWDSVFFVSLTLLLGLGEEQP